MRGDAENSEARAVILLLRPGTESWERETRDFVHLSATDSAHTPYATCDCIDSGRDRDDTCRPKNCNNLTDNFRVVSPQCPSVVRSMDPSAWISEDCQRAMSVRDASPCIVGRQ